jgi:hypothetical protein
MFLCLSAPPSALVEKTAAVFYASEGINTINELYGI